MSNGGGLMALVGYGAQDYFLTAGPGGSSRIFNPTYRLELAMKKVWGKLAEPTARAGVSRIQAIKRHRVQWEKVTSQVLEVGLRPPDETVGFLVRGGAIYREVAADFEEAVSCIR